MGVLDKIESKLGGNKHNTNSKNEKPLYSGSERKSLEQQAVDRDGYGGTNHGTTGYGSGQNTIGHGSGHNTAGYGTGSTHDNNTYGSGTGYGSGQNPNTTTTSDKLRHPVQTATGGNTGRQYDDGYGNSSGPPGAYPDSSSTTGRAGHGGQYDNYGNDGYGQQSSSHKTHAINPVDPRSVRGQNTMADASHYGQGYGATGEPGRDYDNVDRSQHGGIKNALHLGGNSKENHDAIPTAGGEKLGSGGYDNGRDQHHYGRDAAIAGGAAGLGEHEHRRHNDRSDDRHHGRGEYDQSGRLSNDQYGGSSGRSGYPEDSSYTDNSRHGGSGVSGMLNKVTGKDKDPTRHEHGHHGRDEGISSGAGRDAQGLPTEKKLGGAYEAGYRDAMAHLEAEKRH